MISFEVRLVECEAIGWREAYQGRLHYGGHRAGSSAWVAEHETLNELSRRFADDPLAKVVIAPAVIASPGDPALVGTCTTRHFVVHAEPSEVASGSPDETTGGPRPVVVPVDDGSQIRLIGTPGPEGLSLKVEVMDTRISAVHEVETIATVAGKDEAVVRVQMPEVTHREMGGEWHMPADHGLVLSLGVTSEPSAVGKPSIRERLLLIASKTSESFHEPTPSDAAVRQVSQESEEEKESVAPPAALPATNPVVAALPSPAPGALQVVVHPGQVPSALAETPWGLLPIVPVEVVTNLPAGRLPSANPEPMPLPALPSRTLPAAIGTDGQLVDPRTEEDRNAERTDFTPYVDGQPVPSPQVTIPPPSASAEENTFARGDAKAAENASPASVDPDSKRDVSAVTVRFSLNLARGLTVDVDLEKSPEADYESADAGEPPVRR
ncbi:hypothetical protein AB1L88_08625 [Tautonia sp. JC769]|uniref:hypothetical protein n=1 Tax=Tautonia sp. JC769 TaxID=3232135 RepID=UPI003458AB85